MDITVNFSEVVDVITGGGIPTLLLATNAAGTNAVYVSGSGTNALVFRYTVAAGDDSADLNHKSTTALAVNGGSIKDQAGNSATLTLPEVHFNLVRPGIAIYGITPGLALGTAADLGLKPVMTMHASVALTKRVPAGSGISYGHTYHTQSPANLAVIPAGYSDGIPRSASNKAPVLLGGNTYKIAGRVCMDQFVLDVGDAKVAIGDDAVLFGDPLRGEPSVEDWAVAADTIGYEIVTRIASRVDRHYINMPS